MTASEEIIARELGDMYQAETSGSAEKAIVMVGPFTAWLTVAALQLAWRHPSMGEIQRDCIRQVGEQLQVLFAGDLLATLVKGWDRQFDR